VADPAPTLAAKVAALRSASAYLVRPGAVDAIETHMSWVFLTAEHVFKLKKPVRTDGLDCSRLAARHFLCIEELRLNRRLAPSVYLDVVALRQGADGILRIGPEGTVVDWLVMMRRLSADLMLDRLIARGQAGPEHLRQVAARLAGFHRGLPPVHTDPARYLDQLGRQIDVCEQKLRDPELDFDSDEVRFVCAQLRSLLRDGAGLLSARVRAGRIVEGHGDLRPEHVWLGTPLAIIDCLEFSAALRTVDWVDEAGFLALECERLGAPELGLSLLARYRELSGDSPEPPLVDFYQSLRATVRAGIALWHLKEPRYRDSGSWRGRATHYLQLAGAHARQFALASVGRSQPPGISAMEVPRADV
jgi:aminoglycoside phosphotransferase family enzyme